jgi:hypothetical protein
MTAQVQTAGLARITATLAALNWWLGWGIGNSATKSANDLVAAAPEARTVAVAARGTTNVANDKIVLTGVIVASTPKAITEVGAFDAAGTGSPPTGGNMNLYSDFGVINLNTGDSLAYTLNLTFM